MRIQFIIVVLALAALPLVAQSNDVGVWYSTSSLKSTGDDAARLSFEKASGHGVSLNHFWTSSISTELALHRLNAPGRISVDGTPVIDVGELMMNPIVLNAQWHFMRASMISPYVGAGLAYVRTDDLSSSDLDLAGIGRVKFDSKVTWDANAGVNVPLFRRFAIAGDAKYIKYEPTAESAGATETLKLNPLILSLGVKFRW